MLRNTLSANVICFNHLSVLDYSEVRSHRQDNSPAAGRDSVLVEDSHTSDQFLVLLNIV